MGTAALAGGPGRGARRRRRPWVRTDGSGVCGSRVVYVAVGVGGSVCGGWTGGSGCAGGQGVWGCATGAACGWAYGG